MRLKSIANSAHTQWINNNISYPCLITISADITQEYRFNNSNELGIYGLETDQNKLLKFHKLGSYLIEFLSTSMACVKTSDSSDTPCYIIAGDRHGLLHSYLLDSHNHENYHIKDAELGFSEIKHSGPIRFIDSSSLKNNCFSSCSDQAEIFLWDINAGHSPLLKLNSSIKESIVIVKFNNKVDHIIGSTTTSNCFIWDTRTCDSVMRISKSMCQFEPVLMCWSPENSVHLALSDPLNPVAEVQLWDLRHSKHYLSVICKWPMHKDFKHLGINATIDSMSWGISSKINCDQSSDHNLFAVTMSASGGNLSTPVDYLTVWQTNQDNNNQPVCNFISHLGYSLEDSSKYAQTLSGQPPCNIRVDWIPHKQFRGCISYTEGCGLISVHDIVGSRWKPDPGDLVFRYDHLKNFHSSRKIADAFGVEEMTDLTSQILIGQNHTSYPNIDLTNGHALMYESDPIPTISVPPKWMSPSAGAHFTFGGKLITWTCGPTRTKNEQITQNNSSIPNALSRPSDLEADVYVEKPNQDILDSFEFDELKSLEIPHGKNQITVLATPIIFDSKIDVGLMKGLINSLTIAVFENTPTLIEETIVIGQLTGHKELWSFIQNCFGSNKDQGFLTLLGFDPNTIKQVTLSSKFSVSFPREKFDSELEYYNSKCLTDSDIELLCLAMIVKDFDYVFKCCLNGWLDSNEWLGTTPLSSLAILIPLCLKEASGNAMNIQKTYINEICCRLKVYSEFDDRNSWCERLPVIMVAILNSEFGNIVENWPLKDWRLIAALLVSYESNNPDKMISNFHKLIHRTLKQKMYEEALICSVVAMDLKSIVSIHQSQFSSHQTNLPINELIILVLELVYLSRAINDSMETIYKCPDAFSQLVTLSQWLDSTTSSDKLRILALKLLGDPGLTCNEANISLLKYRLWLQLSPEEQKRTKVSMPRSSPFVSQIINYNLHQFLDSVPIRQKFYPIMQQDQYQSNIPTAAYVGWVPQQGVNMAPIVPQPVPPTLPPQQFPVGQPITFGSEHGWNDPPNIPESYHRAKTELKTDQSTEQQRSLNLYNPNDYQLPTANPSTYPQTGYIGFSSGIRMPSGQPLINPVPPSLPAEQTMNYSAQILDQTQAKLDNVVPYPPLRPQDHRM